MKTGLMQVGDVVTFYFSDGARVSGTLKSFPTTHTGECFVITCEDGHNNEILFYIKEFLRLRIDR